MKRDWDLVREILVKLEELPPDTELESDAFPDRDRRLVAYHMKMLRDRGLIDAIEISNIMSMDFMAQRMTWEGQEFLDGIRNDTTWKKVKGYATDKGADLTFETIKALSKMYLKDKLGIDLG